MRLRLFAPCRLMLVAALFAAMPGGSSRSDSSLSPQSNGISQSDPRTGSDQAELAKAPYEVRLRKLHLVRPDLIPYPIFFEVYC